MDSSSPDAHAAVREVPTPLALGYAAARVRAWPSHLARACAIGSLTGTCVPGMAFLLGYRWEFPPVWMLACVALQALCLLGFALAPFTDRQLPKARRAGWVWNTAALAALVLMWSLLAYT